MKEKLIIKNFGPLKSVELELGSFNVLIGDQGTGKSTVAKVLIVIQNTIFMDLFDIPERLMIERKTQLFFEHLKIIGIQNYLYDNTEINYSNPKYSFEFKNRKVLIQQKKEITFKENISYNFNYIPSERSLVITLSDSLFALMQTGTALPQLFLRFGDKFQKARKDKASFDYSGILGINYIYRSEGDIVVLTNGKEIPIFESSSGIQGAIALLTVFDYVAKTSVEGNLLVIEEPELNCFPETQNKIIKHFVRNNILERKDKHSYYKNKILLTTHSPYVLTSLNNMMYAYEVGKTHLKEVEKVIEKTYWLNPADVSAYLMLPEGVCENIFDTKEGLIKAEKIDSVSRILNEEFNALLNVELVKK